MLFRSGASTGRAPGSHLEEARRLEQERPAFQGDPAGAPEFSGWEGSPWPGMLKAAGPSQVRTPGGPEVYGKVPPEKGFHLLLEAAFARIPARAHLPRAPAPTRSPPATTGTPCCPPCKWPAGPAAGPTGSSARRTAAPAPRAASASGCPRSRRRWGRCLRKEDVNRPAVTPCSPARAPVPLTPEDGCCLGPRWGRALPEAAWRTRESCRPAPRSFPNGHRGSRGQGLRCSGWAAVAPMGPVTRDASAAGREEARAGDPRPDSPFKPFDCPAPRERGGDSTHTWTGH